jgi:hypothetical protein
MHTCQEQHETIPQQNLKTLHEDMSETDRNLVPGLGKDLKYVAVEPVKGEFAIVPTARICGWSLSSKMSHDQRDLNVTYLRNLNFRSDFCRF